MKMFFAPLLFVVALCAIQPAHAEEKKARLLQLDPSQQQMLKAAQLVIKHDYSAAIDAYNSVLATDPNNIEAHLQRGVVLRETKDDAGSIADGKAAIALADAGLKQSPNNAVLYHQRGMGYRLARNFAQARGDIKQAIQLAGGKNPSWQNDLDALALEEKIYQ